LRRRSRRQGWPRKVIRLIEVTEGIVRNGILTAVGVVLTIAGLIWALQGFGVIGGSFMSGDSVWAVIGPVVAVVGLVIAGIGVRRARSLS
jgi:hypothetical protein